MTTSPPPSTCRCHRHRDYLRAVGDNVGGVKEALRVSRNEHEMCKVTHWCNGSICSPPSMPPVVLFYDFETLSNLTAATFFLCFLTSLEAPLHHWWIRAKIVILRSSATDCVNSRLYMQMGWMVSTCYCVATMETWVVGSNGEIRVATSERISATLSLVFNYLRLNLINILITIIH